MAYSRPLFCLCLFVTFLTVTAEPVRRAPAFLIKTMTLEEELTSNSFPSVIIEDPISNTYVTGWRGKNILNRRPKQATVEGASGITEILTSAAISGPNVALDPRALHYSNGIIYALSYYSLATNFMVQFEINASTLEYMWSAATSTAFVHTQLSGGAASTASWYLFDNPNAKISTIDVSGNIQALRTLGSVPTNEVDSDLSQTRLFYVPGYDGVATFNYVTNTFIVRPTGNPTATIYQFFITDCSYGPFNSQSFIGFTSDGLAWLAGPSGYLAFDILCTLYDQPSIVANVTANSWPAGMNINVGSMHSSPQICGTISQPTTFPLSLYPPKIYDACSPFMVTFIDTHMSAGLITNITTGQKQCKSTYLTDTGANILSRFFYVWNGKYRFSFRQQFIWYGHTNLDLQVKNLRLTTPPSEQECGIPTRPQAVDCLLPLPDTTPIQVHDTFIPNGDCTGCSNSCRKKVNRTYSWAPVTGVSSCNFAGQIDPNIYHIIYVQDTTGPSISATNYTASCSDYSTPSNYVVNDACSGTDVTVTFSDQIIYKATSAACKSDKIFKIILRKFVATDPCGNQGFASQYITVVDNTPPTFVTPPTSSCTCPQIQDAWSSYLCGGPPTQVSDDCAIGIGYKSWGSYSGSISCPGTNIRTWKVTDYCGNNATATQTINV